MWVWGGVQSTGWVLQRRFWLCILLLQRIRKLLICSCFCLPDNTQHFVHFRTELPFSLPYSESKTVNHETQRLFSSIKIFHVFENLLIGFLFKWAKRKKKSREADFDNFSWLINWPCTVTAKLSLKYNVYNMNIMQSASTCFIPYCDPTVSLYYTICFCFYFGEMNSRFSVSASFLIGLFWPAYSLLKQKLTYHFSTWSPLNSALHILNHEHLLKPELFLNCFFFLHSSQRKNSKGLFSSTPNQK